MALTVEQGPLIASLYASAGFSLFGAMVSASVASLKVRIHGLWWLSALCALATCFQISIALFHTAPTFEYAVIAHKWQNTLAYLLLITLAGLIGDVTQARHTKALVGGLTLIGAVLIPLNALLPFGMRFDSVHAFEIMVFSWGEQLHTLRGEPGWLNPAARTVFISVFLWAFVKTYQQLKSGHVITAVLLGLGVLLLFAATVVSALIEWAGINLIYIGGYGFILFSMIAAFLIMREVRDANVQLANANLALQQELDNHRSTQKIVEHLAYNDTLTDIPNRAGLFHFLHAALDTARYSQQKLAVLHIDIDRFDVINDTLGPNMGDRILLEVAQRIQSHMSGDDFVARLNGDEFICVVTGLHIVTVAETLAAALHQSLTQPFLIDDYQLHITASIGIALFPGDGESTHTLLTASDLAKREAKRFGCNQTRFFHHRLNEAIHERLLMGNALRTALPQRQFELYFQPQVDANNGRITSVEALIRWHHPQEGLIGPDRFIGIAEEMHLMVAIGRWVLDDACRILGLWRRAGITEIGMAVNISAQQLHSSELIDNIVQALARHELSGKDLELEITESMLLDDPDFCTEQLQKLSALGIKIAMDDFGTGYSSLSHLKHLPIDTLKIDRCFVRELENNHDDATICAATISMAKSLGLDTVAEGVENELQAEVLRTLACERFQGFLYARPMPATTACEFIRKQHHTDCSTL
jgi:diguanylate cyclase (GGDEF)-like protein